MRQLAQPASTPQIYLPESVASGIEALHEKCIVVGPGVKVGYAPVINDDLGRFFQPVDHIGWFFRLELTGW